jgi:hypothetical protein
MEPRLFMRIADKNGEIDTKRGLLIDEFALFDLDKGPEHATKIESKHAALKIRFPSTVLDDKYGALHDGALGFRITTEFNNFRFELRDYEEEVDKDLDLPEWRDDFTAPGLINKGSEWDKKLCDVQLYGDFGAGKVRWKVSAPTHTHTQPPCTLTHCPYKCR